MVGLLVTAILALLPAQAPPGAGPVPLRHVIFGVEVDVTTHTSQAQLSGDVGGAPDLSAATHDRVSGTITVDVLEALPDGALAIRISESARNRATSPLTLGVMGDGALAMDEPTSARILPEEAALARLMARQIVATHVVAAGSSWQMERHDQSDVRMHVRVIGEPGSTAHIAIDGSDASKRADGARSTYSVDMMYAVEKTIPVEAAVESDLRNETSLASRHIQMRATYRLKDDSLKSPIRAVP